MNVCQYLGSMMDGDLDEEVGRCISSASKAFGALNRAVFRDQYLSTNTKRLA